MIAQPRVLADEHAEFVDGAIPQIDGMARARASIQSAGGHAGIFERALASGAAAAGHRGDAERDRDAEHDHDLIAWAAWRSGVLGIRDDALTRAGRALGGPRASVVAAALGLHADSIAEFVARQRTDRFWWPDRPQQNGYVMSVGGFSGFGGTWIRPPDHAFALGGGIFRIRVADDWWRLDADVFGWSLRRPVDPVALARQAPTPVPEAAVTRIVLRPDSHLAWIHVTEPAGPAPT